MLPTPAPKRGKIEGKTKWFLHLQQTLKDNPDIITYKQLRKIADPLWIKKQKKNRNIKKK
jgi:hypothetical protein